MRTARARAREGEEGSAGAGPTGPAVRVEGRRRAVGGAAGRGLGRHSLGDGDFRAPDGDGGHPLPTRHHPQPPAPGSALVDSSAALAPSRPEEEGWGVLQGQGS